MNDFNPPKTLDKAVESVTRALSLKERVFIAGLERKDLGLVRVTLGALIRDECGFAVGNTALIQSCREWIGSPSLTADQAFWVVVEALWKRLRDTHSLRLVEGDDAPGEPGQGDE
jgi:hypothetical protein